MGNSKNHHRNHDVSHEKIRPGGFGDKFRQAADDHLLVTKSNGRKELLKSADKWEGEGVDHINIFSRAETKLGRMLDFDYRLPFKHSIFDTFSTLSGFWFYIRSDERPDELRKIFKRTELLEVARKLTNRKVKHVTAMVMHAAYERIKSNTELHALMYNSELPFDVYRTNEAGVRIRLSHRPWVVDGYSEIQRAIQTGTEPDFTFLCDTPPLNGDIYESVRPVVSETVKKQRDERAAPPVVKSSKNKRSEKSDKQHSKQTSDDQNQVFHSKPRRTEYTFNPKNGYTLLVPVHEESTETLILKTGRKTVKINGASINTGAVTTGVSLPLLRISDHKDLFDSGLISDNDVVRAAPILEQTFSNGFGTNNVIKIEDFVIEKEDESITIPLGLKLINKSFTREGDVQTFEMMDDGTGVLKRDVLLYKPLQQIVSSTGKTPSFINEVMELRNNLESPETYTYVILRVCFELHLRTDVAPEIKLDGEIMAVGLSTGTHDDTGKKVSLIGITDHSEVLNVSGYTFTLYRGRLHSAVADQAAPNADTPAEDEQVLVEVVRGERLQSIVVDQEISDMDPPAENDSLLVEEELVPVEPSLVEA